MKRYIFILIVIIFSSCNDSKTAHKVELKKIVKKEPRPFFDSGKIDHYMLDSSEEVFTKLIYIDHKTKREQKLFDVLVGDYPETIPKEDFEETLLNINYKKSKLSIKQQKEIEGVFSEKDSLQNDGYACVPRYADIFVFKKKEKAIGIAKICFHCGRFQIIGAKLDVSGFGLWSELAKLKNIVRPEKKT